LVELRELFLFHGPTVFFMNKRLSGRTEALHLLAMIQQKSDSFGVLHKIVGLDQDAALRLRYQVFHAGDVAGDDGQSAGHVLKHLVGENHPQHLLIWLPGQQADFRASQVIGNRLVRHERDVLYDILDLPLLVATIIFLFRQGITLTTSQALVFLITLVSGMVIVTAIHIAVAALGVMTTEVDHTIMIYRDLSMMARVPVDVYTDSVRALLTFVIPIAVAYTLPAKSLLGLVTLPTVLLALVISALALTLSLRLWHYALTQYSSASS